MKLIPVLKKHPSSFRDPSGFVFEAKGIFYRQVCRVYADHYEHLIRSGLYSDLVKKNF